MKKVVIASDHAGVELKKLIIETFNTIEFDDLGPYSNESVDYPDYAHPLASKINNDSSLVGILICGTGNGVCITANKYKKVRAALCWYIELAQLAREHNDANVVCLPARFISTDKAIEIVATFFNTSFQGGRHSTRVEKISNC